MPSYGRTAEGALIARRSNYDHVPPDRLIERLSQVLFFFGERLCQGKAQVDYSRAGINTFDDCGSEFLRGGTWHLFPAHRSFGENGANQERTVRTNGWRRRIPRCG